MRIIALDFLRFLAAMSVAAPHLVIYFARSEDTVALEIITSLSVEIFFVLSGFVLCPFLVKIFRSSSGMGKNLWVFLVRRWMRTLPLYFLALTFFVILFSGKWDRTALQYLLFLQNFHWPPPQFDYFSVSWSLAVEEWFYILFPAFIALVFWAGGIVRPGRDRDALFLVGAIAFVVVFSAFRLAADVPSENWGYAVRRVVLFRIDSIGFGILLYLFRGAVYRIPVIVIAAVVVVAAVYLFDGYGRILAGGSPFIESRFLIFVATAVFSCAVLSLFLRLDDLFQKRMRGLSLWGGRVSYGIYLLHIPVAALVGTALDAPAGIFLAASIVGVLAVTTGVYYFFEKPILDARPDFRFDD